MATTFDVPSKMKARVYVRYGSVEDVRAQFCQFLQDHQSVQATRHFSARVPGYDVPEVVLKVGSEVKGLKVGDKVYGSGHHPNKYGTLAKYTAVEEKFLMIKPKSLSFKEATSLPIAIQTSYAGLLAAELSSGKSLLVLGGVGSLAVQVGKEVFGASRVAATSSTSKLEFLMHGK